jgi:ABC-type polysaccharide/polyol phosphate export permease
MHDSGLKKSLALAWMLAKRDLKNRYATTYAGIAWNVIVPLLYALINVVVFSILMKGRMGARYGDLPFALFYFVPFALWAFFSEVTGRSTTILREYGFLINKIAFPFWVLPLVPLASALLNQLILFIIIGVLLVVYGVVPASSAYLFVLVWMVSVVLTTGIAYAVAALSVYVPDLTQIVPVTINILFWLTPILYPATLVEDHGALWVRSLIMDYNPFSSLVEMSRHSLFGTAQISFSALAGLALLACMVLALGLALFRKLKSGFADVL